MRYYSWLDSLDLAIHETGEAGLLPRDQAIGGAVYLAGVLIYAVAIVGGWRILTSSRQAPLGTPASTPTGGSGR